MFQYGSRPVYARLQSPAGTTTIALHQVEPGKELPPFDSIRLYFEVKELTDALCKSLAGSKGVETHATAQAHAVGLDPSRYLNDPDGHEVELGVIRLA